MKTVWSILSMVWLTGCVADALMRPLGTDSRFVTIQTVSLFNQRQESRFAKQKWRGDWLFRRARLDLIDRELRTAKPDIIVMQEVMSKIENPSESDRNILLAGAMREYDWHYRGIRDYEDSQESESMAVAVGLPLKIDRPATLSRREFWELGDDGFLVATEIDFEGRPLIIFNVQMPSAEVNRDIWYTFIGDRIHERLLEVKICSRRLVISGYLPGSLDSQRYRALRDRFELKDTSEGFCEQEGTCYTATPINEIFMGTVGDQRPARNDRILVHQDAFVRAVGVNFDKSVESEEAKSYGIEKLWPTQRFGWYATLRFPACEADAP
jgi:endonuclease/exonuclease/phosphatase family metal-dependent hydrolase